MVNSFYKIFINKIPLPVNENTRARIHYYLLLIFIGTLYFVAGKIGLALAFEHSAVSPFWPATGISLTAFVIFGFRIWPAIAAGAFLLNFSNETAFMVSAGIAAGNLLEGLAGGYLLKRYIIPQRPFMKFPLIFFFTLISGFAAAISASIGVTVLTFSGLPESQDYLNLWFTWWCGDMAGALIVAPVLLLWKENPVINWKISRAAEFIALVSFLLLYTHLVFTEIFPISDHLEFFAIPLLILTAFRFGPREVATIILLVSILAIVETLDGSGPFISSDPNQSLRSLQIFMALIFLSALPLSSALSQKKETEQALREEEERYRTLFETAIDAIVTFNEEGRILFYNTAAENMFGYMKNELSRKNISSLIPGYSLNQQEFPDENNISPEHREYTALHNTGEEFFVEVSEGEYKGGGQSQFTCVIRDITERKKIEDYLLKNKAEMDDFFENAPMALHWITLDGVIQRANKAELNLLGYERDEYIGRHISEFCVDSSVVDGLISKSAEKEELVNFRVQLRHKDGSLRTVLIDTNFSEEGGKYIRCFTRDITEQLKAEETKTLLASLVESSDDAIIGKNLEGNIISWNYGAEKIYGYSEKEIIGKNVSILVPSERTNEYPELLAKLIAGEKIQQYESQRICKDGSIIHISLTFSPIRNSAGEIIGVSGIERDITAKKTIAVKLENSLREKEVLLKEIHHRVKNNLQIISSLLNLQSGYIENKKDLGLFKESQNRIRAMALIHEKLYRSKEFHQIDIEGYLKDLVANLFRSYNISNGNLNFDLNVRKFYLGVDKIVTLGLIINELVTNSINHAFRNKEYGKIYIDLYEKDGNIILTEGDSGKGLPPDFDFNKTESLGLKLVLTLVEQLEGTIAFRKGEITEFKIVFPKNSQDN